MNITFEKKGNLEGVVSLTLEKSDYDEKVVKELKEIGRTRQIPGFRKGHIELAQLRKRFGKDVKTHVLNEMASENILKYLEDNKIDTLGYPIPAEGHNFNLDDDTVNFAYEVGIAPELNIQLDKNTTIDFYNIEVSQEMIDEQVKNILMRCGEQVPAQEYAERALVKGSMLQLDDTGNVKSDGIQVESTIIAPFNFKNAELAAKFEGTKAGDKVVFNPFDTCEGNEAEVASMLNIDRDKVEQANSNFELTITEYTVHKAAEENQETYDKAFGEDKVHNHDEFIAQVKNSIALMLQPNSRQLFVRTAEDYLMEKYGNDMELPENFLKRFLILTEKDVNEENINDVYAKSVSSIKWELIENKTAEMLAVKVSEDDVKSFARMYAIDQLNQYGMGAMAEQMADYYAENMLKDKKQSRRLARQAFTGKLFTAIHNAVNLNEHTVSMEEFRTMVDKLNATSNTDADANEPEETEE